MGPLSEFGPWLPLLLRPLAFGASTPLLTRRLPTVVKLAMGSALALGMAGTAPRALVAPWSIAALGGELAAGIALALATGIGVWAAVGAAAAVSAGAGAARRPPRAALGQPWTEAFGVGATAILLTAGAHRPALRLLEASWQVLPPGRAGELFALARGAEAAVAAGADVLMASAALATPAFAVALLTTATLATLRAASQSAGPRLAATLAVEPTALLVVVGVAGAAAAAGWMDEALVHSFDIGLRRANSLLEAWRLGGAR